MSQEKEYTGGSVSYYSIDVNAPINEASDPYTAECQDIIEALKLDFNEGNVLRAIWSRAAASLRRTKKGYDDGLYDAEKILFYGQRLVAAEQRVKRSGEVVNAFVQDLFCTACAKGHGVHAADCKTPSEDPYGPRDVEGWYAWNGDETMRPAGRVDIIRRDGTFVGGRSAENEVRWTFTESASMFDIVKWRPAQ